VVKSCVCECLLLLAFFHVIPAPLSAQPTERVSVSSVGNQGNGLSFSPAISADGRFVVFGSNASNLVDGDTNNSADIFVHDRQTGITERLSVDSFGNQGNAGSSHPSISADGRFVAFQSGASNLVDGDTNNRADVFVHDRQTGTTKRVSVDSLGNQGNSHSTLPAISADGSFVAFESYASNLVDGDTNNVNSFSGDDIFVYTLNNTSTGNYIVVKPEPNTSLTFTSVTFAGNTTVTTSSAGPTPPTGFSLGDPPTYYDVTTTATFSGAVTFCVIYNPALFVDPSSLTLQHFESIAWVDVTTSNNTSTNTICGQVTSFSFFAIAERLISVSVDIKPGSYPNTINLGSGGTVPVAILSTATFDARTVNPSSVTLASAPVKLTGKGTPMYSIQDVNGDGRLDLIVHVTTSAFQVTTTDTLAVLKGKTTGGVSIRGTDTVRVVP